MAASQKKNSLYVGGIAQQVTEEVLHAAFIPFGDIKSIQIPKDFTENKNRGFGFVDYELEEDCAAAVENMDGAELFGKTLRCNIARPTGNRAPGKAVWSAEEWIQKQLIEDAEYNDVEEEEELAPLAPN